MSGIIRSMYSKGAESGERRKKNGMKTLREREKEESNADVIIKCTPGCEVSMWW
jgi:hypothetical protein